MYIHLRQIFSIGARTSNKYILNFSSLSTYKLAALTVTFRPDLHLSLRMTDPLTHRNKMINSTALSTTTAHATACISGVESRDISLIKNLRPHAAKDEKWLDFLAHIAHHPSESVGPSSPPSLSLSVARACNK